MPFADSAAVVRGRSICLDVETSGLAVGTDEIVEIGMVEMMDARPTGRTWQSYVRPVRATMSPKASEITGICDADLVSAPLFSEIAKDVADFISGAVLIAHNAAFDRGFLNAALASLGYPELPEERFVDTVAVARAKLAKPAGKAKTGVKYPARFTLDALKKFYGLTAERKTHGALKDALILSDVVARLIGGLNAQNKMDFSRGAAVERAPAMQRPKPLKSRITDDEKTNHAAFMATLGDDGYAPAPPPRPMTPEYRAELNAHMPIQYYRDVGAAIAGFAVKMRLIERYYALAFLMWLVSQPPPAEPERRAA